MSNQVQNRQNNQVSGNRPKFSQVIQSDAIQNLIANTLGDRNQVRTFIASISSAVASNPTLQECTPFSVINAALTGETLGLAHSVQMGHYYIVPFNNNKLGVKEGQFQLGYKGYLQLAMRSGEYKKIVATPVKEGELIDINPFTETYTLQALPFKERVKAKTVGFYGYFETKNGMTKEIYMSMEEMEEHALKYSMGYRAKRGYTFWEKNFDEMGNKTILRQLISKWGIMSIEMQTAYERDMGVIREDGTVDYVDNEQDFGSTQEIIQQDEVETVETQTGEVVYENNGQLNLDDL